MKKNNEPIFITGVERSGASLIARILTITEGTFVGNTSKMFENYKLRRFSANYLNAFEHSTPYPRFEQHPPVNGWKEAIEDLLLSEQYKKDMPWMFKHSSITPLWWKWHEAYPDARWIIVRRKPTEIINSCQKTTYMTTFKDEAHRKLVGVENEADGWLWWIRQYEQSWKEMIEAGINYKVIWPDRMITGDYSQIYDMLDWLNLKWDTKIVDTIDPLLNKPRNLKIWQ